ncbi:MAG: hypothetical protein WBB39_02510 [Candidatus Saccharimonadales bacterium]
MKDFDFDELDRAVSSVLTKQHTSQVMGDDKIETNEDRDHSHDHAATDLHNSSSVPVSSDPTPRVLPDLESMVLPQVEDHKADHQSLDRGDDESAVGPEERAEHTRQESSVDLPVVPAAEKRGRFMDFVPTDPLSTKHTVTQRGGKTITPPTDFNVQNSIKDAVVHTNESNQTSDEQIDAIGNVSVKSLNADNDEASGAISSGGTPITAEHSPTNSTPFIADLNIEKRPLGGKTYDTEKNLVARPVALDHKSSLEPPVAPIDTMVAVAIPAEIDRAITEVESREISTENHGATTDTAASDKKLPHSGTEDISTTTANDTVAVPDTQQHTVFDSESYNQPLVKEPGSARKPAALWLLIGVVFLLIGSAIGALYFLYGQS